MIDYNRKIEIPIFIYGTLRQDQPYNFFLNRYKVKHISVKGFQLMELESGNVYIKRNNRETVLGEFYKINFATLQQINHLEYGSGSFDKKYELVLYNPKNGKSFFYFKLKKNRKISSGDISKRGNIVEYISDILSCKTINSKITHKKLVSLIKKKFNNTPFIIQ